MISDTGDIRKARKSLDWTQKDLAQATGLSQSAIAKIERGRYGLSHATFLRIAEALERRRAELGRAVTLGQVMVGRIISLGPHEPVSRAALLMEEHSISQIPVFEGRAHVGTVSSTGLACALARNPRIRLVREAMGRELPMLNRSTQVGAAVAGLLEQYRAILVTDAGEIVGIVTSEDLLRRSFSAPGNM
jgi:predicted transcriptional regulator